jgi:hypothetical protein
VYGWWVYGWWVYGWWVYGWWVYGWWVYGWWVVGGSDVHGTSGADMGTAASTKVIYTCLGAGLADACKKDLARVALVRDHNAVRRHNLLHLNHTVSTVVRGGI